MEEGLVDGRGYIDDAYGVNDTIGATISRGYGRSTEDLCKVTASDSALVGTASARDVDEILNELAVPHLRPLVSTPDIHLQPNLVGSMAMWSIGASLREPKISFGLTVTWVKGENGEPNKETYETEGNLKRPN